MAVLSALLCRALGVALSVFSAALHAQPAEKTARIGYLTSHSPETFRVQAFRQGLRELGWVEGRNLTSTIARRTESSTVCH